MEIGKCLEGKNNWILVECSCSCATDQNCTIYNYRLTGKDMKWQDTN